MTTARPPWTDLTPGEAKDIFDRARVRAGALGASPSDAATAGLEAIAAAVLLPMTSNGEFCPFPWDPQQLAGAPIGMYHCPYCGEMVMAGLPHVDYSEEEMGSV